jgi:hypothetical protein
MLPPKSNTALLIAFLLVSDIEFNFIFLLIF